MSESGEVLLWAADVSSLEGDAVISMVSVGEAELVDVKSGVAIVGEEAVDAGPSVLSGTFDTEPVGISRETEETWLINGMTVDSRPA